MRAGKARCRQTTRDPYQRTADDQILLFEDYCSWHDKVVSGLCPLWEKLVGRVGAEKT